MHELFLDDTFNDYQVKLIEEINKYVICLMNQGRFEEMKGAIGLAEKVIKFPFMTCKKDDVRAHATENIKRFQSRFITAIE